MSTLKTDTFVSNSMLNVSSFIDDASNNYRIEWDENEIRAYTGVSTANLVARLTTDGLWVKGTDADYFISGIIDDDSFSTANSTTISTAGSYKTYISTFPTDTWNQHPDSPLTLSGTTNDFTNIPSGIDQLFLAWYGANTSDITLECFRFGDSGGFDATGYLYANGYSTGGTRFRCAQISSGVPAGQKGHGIAWFARCRNNDWIYHNYDDSEGSDGGIYLSMSGELTQIRMLDYANNSSYNAGTLELWYR